jgi:hypothetical protein
MPRCAACQFDGYPEVYSPDRQNAGLIVFVISVAYLIGGLLVFGLRRNEHLFKVRSRWAIYLSALNLLVLLSFAIREYVGEGRWPCILQKLIDCFCGTMLPACQVIRVLGTYSKHLQQSRVRHTSSNRDIAAVHSIGPPSSRSYARCSSMLDGMLLRTRFYNDRAQVHAALWCGTPWLILYFSQLVTSPPSRTLGAVGCRADTILFIIAAIVVIVLLVLLLPVYLRLMHTPDLLHLRHEILVELVVAPFIVVWYLFCKLSPSFEVNVLTGNYAIIAYAALLFGVAVWLPGLLTFLPSQRAAPSALLQSLAHDAAVPTTSAATSSGTAPTVENTVTPHASATTLEDAVSPVASASASARGPPLLRPDAMFLDGIADVGLEDALRFCAVSRLVSPTPSLTEARALLQQPALDVAASSRSLRVVSVILLFLPSGRSLLFESLAREFCSELGVFLVEATLLRATISAFQKRVTTSLRALAAATTPDGDSARLLRTEESDSPPHLEASARRGVGVHFSALVERASALMINFVVPGAESQVNLSAQAAESLTAAYSALVAASAPAGAPSLPQTSSLDTRRRATASALAASLHAAEKEVFYSLVSGPVFHLVQRPEYTAWASGVEQDASP